MAEFDEFPAFLVIGLVIMAVLIAAFSITPATAEDGRRRVPDIVILNRTEGIFVGETTEDALTPFTFRFEANNRRQLNSVDLGTMEISNGVLFNEKGFAYNITGSNLEDVKIKFRVNRTNGLDALVVLLDGEKVGEARSAGDYEFDLHTSGPASVELRALSSSWQMWAPNIYVLENVRIESYAFAEKNDIFRFTLTEEEAKNFISGKIDFVLTQNIGKIILELNGVEVYRGQLNDIHTVRIDSRGIRAGRNALLIRAERSAQFRGNAAVAIFFHKQIEKKAVTLFALTDQEWTRIQTGEIRFVMPRVLEEGGAAVRLVHNNTVLFSDFVRTEETRHIIEFDQRHVRPGLNQLVIESLNGAKFEVADIEVRI